MSGDILKLAKPSGNDPWGNSALPEDVIAKTRSKEELNRRVKELEKNIEDITKVNEAQEKERQKAAAKNAPANKTAPGKAARTSHIGHTRNHRAVAIEPDICRVGKCIVAFNSYSILPDETAGSHNVKAIGTRVLREGDLIKGVQADAGKNIASGTSLCDGYLAILEGHANVKSNGARVARHNSLCRINTNESGAVGPLARMMTVVKPVGVPSAPADTRPPPGERTSERLEALKKLREKNSDKLLDFDTADETFRFKELTQSTHDVIGLIKGEPGTLVDHGAQALRAGLGFTADMGIGIAELAYDGIKLVPKTLQSNLTVPGLTEKLLDNAILLEDLRLGNITPGTIGQGALDIGAAIVKPVTEPWKKGQTTEAIFRGGIEIGTFFLSMIKASKLKKAVDAQKVAEAADEARKAGEVVEEARKAALAGEEARRAANLADEATDVPNSARTGEIDGTLGRTEPPTILHDGVYVGGHGAKRRVFAASDPGVPELIAEIEKKFPGKVRNAEINILRPDGTPYTDFDIVTDTHVIQVKLGTGKGIVPQIQVSQTLTDLKVIGFDVGKLLGTNKSFKPTIMKNAAKENIFITNDLDELFNIIGPQ